jgi:hypothetical protein
MTERVEQLGQELRREWPHARVQWSLFPSGAAMLDVFCGERWFQLAYFPSYRLFGVDETREEDSFSNYYRFTSPDFGAAAAELRRLVAGAMAGAADSSSQPRRAVS